MPGYPKTTSFQWICSPLIKYLVGKSRCLRYLWGAWHLYLLYVNISGNTVYAL